MYLWPTGGQRATAPRLARGHRPACLEPELGWAVWQSYGGKQGVLLPVGLTLSFVPCLSGGHEGRTSPFRWAVSTSAPNSKNL